MVELSCSCGAFESCSRLAGVNDIHFPYLKHSMCQMNENNTCKGNSFQF